MYTEYKKEHETTKTFFKKFPATVYFFSLKLEREMRSFFGNENAKSVLKKPSPEDAPLKWVEYLHFTAPQLMNQQCEFFARWVESTLNFAPQRLRHPSKQIMRGHSYYRHRPHWWMFDLDHAGPRFPRSLHQ